jgi:hypothetical protein
MEGSITLKVKARKFPSHGRARVNETVLPMLGAKEEEALLIAQYPTVYDQKTKTVAVNGYGDKSVDKSVIMLSPEDMTALGVAEGDTVSVIGRSGRRRSPKVQRTWQEKSARKRPKSRVLIHKKRPVPIELRRAGVASPKVIRSFPRIEGRISGENCGCCCNFSLITDFSFFTMVPGHSGFLNRQQGDEMQICLYSDVFHLFLEFISSIIISCFILHSSSFPISCHVHLILSPIPHVKKGLLSYKSLLPLCSWSPVIGKNQDDPSSRRTLSSTNEMTKNS